MDCENDGVALLDVIPRQILRLVLDVLRLIANRNLNTILSFKAITS